MGSTSTLAPSRESSLGITSRASLARGTSTLAPRSSVWVARASTRASATYFPGTTSGRMPRASNASAVRGPTAHTRAAPNARASRPRASSRSNRNRTALPEVRITQS